MSDLVGSVAEDFEVGPGFDDLLQLGDWLMCESAPDEGFEFNGLTCGGESNDFELKDANFYSELEGLFANASSSAFSNNSSDADRHDRNLPCADTRMGSDDENKKFDTQGTAEMARGSSRKIENHKDGNPEPKRQLRLVKNREAAAQSRQRKKFYIQDLESKCRMWENYCNQLQQSIAFTCAENTTLRNELSRCKRQKGGNVVSEPAVLKDSLLLESPSHLTTLVVAGLHFGNHCLRLLLAVLILILLGEVFKPSGKSSMNKTKNEDNSSSFRIAFINFGLKRQVLEAFPLSRSRAFSSCRHRFWRLDEFSPTFSIPS
eukprot:Gb_41342 [translate_table: standard]